MMKSGRYSTLQILVPNQPAVRSLQLLIIAPLDTVVPILVFGQRAA